MNEKWYKNKYQNGCSMLFEICVLFMLGPYLLLSRFDYTNMTASKYAMFLVVSVVMTVFFVLSAAKYHKDICLWVKENRRVFLWTMVFMGSMVISVFLAQHGKIAWIGERGRRTGTLTMLLCCGMMLSAGIHCRLRRFTADWFIVFAGVTGIWGSLNALGVDVFHMHENIVDWMAQDYMSGIGQKTFYSAVLLMASAMALILYIYEENIKKRLFYFGNMGVLFFSGFLSRSDNFILTLFFVLILAMMWGTENAGRMNRFLNSVILLMFLAVLLDCILPRNGAYNDRFDFAAGLLVRTALSRIMLLVAVIIRAVLYYAEKKHIRLSIRIAPQIFPLFLVFCVLCGIGVIFYFTWIAPDIKLEEKWNYLRFNDSWGSNRGFIWKHCAEIFKRVDFIHKAFGNGADLTGYLMINYFGEEALSVGGYWNNAHNEYLQYLLSFGITGLVSYCGMVYDACKKMLGKQNAEGRAVFMAVFAYLVQAFVGVNNIMVTPLLFVLLGVGLAENGAHDRKG